jgi:hypothetical protein
MSQLRQKFTDLRSRRRCRDGAEAPQSEPAPPAWGPKFRGGWGRPTTRGATPT